MICLDPWMIFKHRNWFILKTFYRKIPPGSLANSAWGLAPNVCLHSFGKFTRNTRNLTCRKILPKIHGSFEKFTSFQALKLIFKLLFWNIKQGKIVKIVYILSVQFLVFWQACHVTNLRMTADSFQCDSPRYRSHFLSIFLLPSFL